MVRLEGIRPTRGRREDWSHAGVEPSLEELINGPIVQVVMRRDRVAMPDLLGLLEQAAAGLRNPLGTCPDDHMPRRTQPEG